MHKLNIDHVYFSSVSEEALRKGNSSTFKVNGNSMKPFILPGDTLTVEPIMFKALQVGDIVFCNLPNNRIVVHSYIGRHSYPDSDHLMIKGDALHQETEYATEDQVLGRVVEVVRANKIVNLTGSIYRLSVFFWVKTYPVSAFLYFLPGRVVGKCFRLLSHITWR